MGVLPSYSGMSAQKQGWWAGAPVRRNLMGPNPYVRNPYGDYNQMAERNANMWGPGKFQNTFNSFYSPAKYPEWWGDAGEQTKDRLAQFVDWQGGSMLRNARNQAGQLAGASAANMRGGAGFGGDPTSNMWLQALRGTIDETGRLMDKGYGYMKDDAKWNLGLLQDAIGQQSRAMGNWYQGLTGSAQNERANYAAAMQQLQAQNEADTRFQQEIQREQQRLAQQNLMNKNYEQTQNAWTVGRYPQPQEQYGNVMEQIRNTQIPRQMAQLNQMNPWGA